MNIANPLIPRAKAIKEKKLGHSRPFRDDFWVGFSDSSKYNSRKNHLLSSVRRFDSYRPTQRIYVQADLDFMDKNPSKTSTPSQIWDEAGLEVVASERTDKVTVAGTKVNFDKLQEILNTSNFEVAKTSMGNTKVKNISREIYALSNLNDKTVDLVARTDSRLFALLELGFTERVKCSIEFYSTVPRYKVNDFADLIRLKIHTELTVLPAEQIIHNFIMEAYLNSEEIRSLLTETSLSDIQIIRLKGKLLLQRLIPDINLSDVRVTTPSTQEIVGVIDSGVSHALLDPSRFNREIFLPSGKTAELQHGTFVASRILFGIDIFSQTKSGSLTPLCKYLDVQVAYALSGDSSYEDINLKEAIEEVFRRYPDVVVFNISMNQYEGLLKSDFNKPIDRTTEFLDELARKYDKLVIISAGNHIAYQSYTEDYNGMFQVDNQDTFVAPPADAINVLTIGSVTNVEGNMFICGSKMLPSPFSRRGHIRNNWRKPELTHFGGNILKEPLGNYSDGSYEIANRNQAGVEGLANSGLYKDVGTSHSAPIVSREAIVALDRLKRGDAEEHLKMNGNRANLLRAILIHSTKLTHQSVISDVKLKQAYGFGLPDGLACFSDDRNRATILYSDELTSVSKKQKLKIKLPEEIVGRKTRFTLTAAYNPPVNSNFPQEYNSLIVESNLRFTEDISVEAMSEAAAETVARTEGQSKAIIKVKYVKKPSTHDQYTNDCFPVSSIVCEGNTPTVNMEVIVQLTERPRYLKEMSGKIDEISQNYALVLTIEDLEETNTLKEALINTEQFIEVTNEVEQTLEVES